MEGAVPRHKPQRQLAEHQVRLSCGPMWLLLVTGCGSGLCSQSWLALTPAGPQTALDSINEATGEGGEDAPAPAGLASATGDRHPCAESPP